MIKTILVDDHELVRAGMSQMLSDAEWIQIIGEASTGTEGINLVRELRPDVAVIDFKLPDITGLEVATKMLRIEPELKILVVTSVTNDLIPFRLLEAGVKGFLTKDAAKDELIRAIQTVNTGQQIISPKITSRLALSGPNHKTTEVFDVLSDRETEIMMMVIRGISVKGIADKLFLSPKTVHSYRSKIFQKLNVNGDVDLTLLALRHGIINLDEDSQI